MSTWDGYFDKLEIFPVEVQIKLVMDMTRAMPSVEEQFKFIHDERVMAWIKKNAGALNEVANKQLNQRTPSSN